MKSTRASARARKTAMKSIIATGCAAGPLQLPGESLQFHEVFETLLDRALQVLAEQRAIDVLLVSLDDRVRLELRQLLRHVLIITSHHKSGSSSSVFANNPKIPPVWMKTTRGPNAPGCAARCDISPKNALPV